MIGGFRHYSWWASTSLPSACLRRHRLVSSPSWLAYYAFTDVRLWLLHWPSCLSLTDYFAAMVTQLCHCCQMASSTLLAGLTAVNWVLLLHGCATSSLLIGITIFTTTNIFCHLWWAILSLYWSSCLYANCVSYHQWTIVTTTKGQAICSGAY